MQGEKNWASAKRPSCVKSNSRAHIVDVNKSTNNVHKNMERMFNGHKIDVTDMSPRSTLAYRMYEKETVMLEQRL